MVVILVALMVAIVLVVEYLRYRGRKQAVKLDEVVGPSITIKVDGFALPQSIAYHPLHTWAYAIDAQTARVGIDDLARRLIGRVDRVVPPTIGTELQQGQSSMLLGSRKRLTAVVSPVAGEVVKANEELWDEPQLASKDPYGRGWLFEIRSWRLAEQLSGLLAGNTAKRWMELSAHRLRAHLGDALGGFAHDGGELVEDLGSQFDRDLWVRLILDFLGTESMEYE